MNYIVKVGILKGEEGYSYSIWIETDYGAVIDMWSDYITVKKIEEVYTLVTREMLKKFNRIIHEPSSFYILVDNRDFKDYLNGILGNDMNRLFEEMTGEKPKYEITISVDVTEFQTDDRVYSLAMMALDMKRRYPPIL